MTTKKKKSTNKSSDNTSTSSKSTGSTNKTIHHHMENAVKEFNQAISIASKALMDSSAVDEWHALAKEHEQKVKKQIGKNLQEIADFWKKHTN